MKKIFFLIIALAVLILIFSYSTKDIAAVNRFNPFVKETTSYAKVPTGTQIYKGITLIDNKKNIVIVDFGGYDPEGVYVKVKHKRNFVKHVDYITAEKIPKTIRKDITH
ncbi:YxeA family protein [Brochothrix thermosphacta]|uniref:YxeA family protein n=1 Tax=Brochothrix thermosphacta TaxID=2756 RepID=UPI00083F6E6E|nr:YxeA family protein [Brochothrix thermosphacta]ODJ67905.1 hypothetical protein BFR35_00130 [Brochothrix thermosphacta]